MATPDGNAVDWFVDRHVREGDASGVAFEDPWRSLTRAGLAEATRKFAGALARDGIGRERRLVMLLPDTVDFPIVFWGALRAGVIPVPINTLLTPDLVRHVLEDSRAEAVAIAEPLLPGLLTTLRGIPSLRKIIVTNPDGSAPATPDDLRAVGLSLRPLAHFTRTFGSADMPGRNSSKPACPGRRRMRTGSRCTTLT